MRFRNYRNRYNKKNRIYSEEELLAMTLNDLLDDEPVILAQDKEIGIPSYEELRQSPNTRWIDKYTDEYGQQHGGYYGSIGDYDESFAPKQKFPPIDKDRYKTYPKYMIETEMPEEEEEESPIVLEGGVEENVYYPDEEITLPEEEQKLPSDDVDKDENKFDLDDDALLDILQGMFKNLSSTQVQTPQISEIWNNNQNNTLDIPTQRQNVTLPNTWQYSQTTDLERFYKELLEELRKRLRLGSWSTEVYNTVNKYNGLTPWSAGQKVLSKAVSDDILENEYYKNALRMADGEPLTEKFLEENDVYSYQDILDPEKSNYYREQLAKMYGLDVNAPDINEKLKDKKIVIPKESSRLYQYAKNSEAMQKWISENYEKIKNGEKYDEQITFPLNINEITDSQKRGMYTTIHNANLKNMKINSDGSITGRLVDPYNYEEWLLKHYSDAKNLKDIPSIYAYNKITRINNRAFEQQRKGKLEPFYIDMPISLSKGDIVKITPKRNKY